MRKINVAKAFNLRLSLKVEPLRFEPGEHEVSDEVASHWYTQEHLAAGGVMGAAKARAAADAAFLAAKAATCEYERLEAEAQKAQVEAGVEVEAPAHVRLMAPAEPEAPVAEKKPRRRKGEAAAESVADAEPAA